MSYRQYGLTPDELSKLSEKDLRKELNRLNTIANKRLARLEKSGQAANSWAYKTILDEISKDGKFKTPKIATKQLLYNRYKTVSKFLNQKSSTVSDAKKEAKRIGRLFGTVDSNEIKRIMNVVNKIKEQNLALFNIVGSERIIKYTSEMVLNKDMTIDQMLDDAEDFLIRSYEDFVMNDDDYDDGGFWLG